MADSVIFLLLTLVMLVILLVLGVRTYRKKDRERIEQPKYRMLDDD